MTAYSKNTKIISMNGGFVSNAVCDTCTTVIPAEAELKEKLEASLAETKLQQYRVTEENGQITICKRCTCTCKYAGTWCQCGRCDI